VTAAAVKAAGLGDPKLACLLSSDDIGAISGRIRWVLAPETERGWSVPLVKGRVSKSVFQMRSCGGIAVVELRGSVHQIDGGTHVRVRVATLLPSLTARFVLLACYFGALLTFGGLITVGSVSDLVLAIAVPFFSGTFVILVTLLPAGALLTLRHSARQSKWLRAFVEGVVGASPASDD
jgi:hypothetical protein